MFGLIGLVLALVIVGVLVKKQTGSLAAPAVPGIASAPAGGAAPTVRGQSQQLQQDIRKSLDAAMQPRPVPEDE
jgi:hypothetical protein